MLSESELKERLIACSGTEGKLPAPDELDVLVPAMLEHIGSIDSELRDDLIYSLFGRWILREGIVSETQCREILAAILDEKHLLYKIGEKDTDSVFTRSFSVLLLPLLLIKHRRAPYLSLEELNALKGALLRMAREEKDRRGYVEGRGWAHAVAHTADALDDLAQCVEFGESELREILSVLRPLITGNEFVYGFGEDERMATPVIALLRRELIPIAEMESWIRGLVEVIEAEKSIPARQVKRSNVQNFLKSLYFRIKWANASPGLLPVIEDVLKKINPLAGN